MDTIDLIETSGLRTWIVKIDPFLSLEGPEDPLTRANRVLATRVHRCIERCVDAAYAADMALFVHRWAIVTNLVWSSIACAAFVVGCVLGRLSL